MFHLERFTDVYRKYCSNLDQINCQASITLETGWHLESMIVSPERKGFGQSFFNMYYKI
jgi:hypothetical protein